MRSRSLSARGTSIALVTFVRFHPSTSEAPMTRFSSTAFLTSLACSAFAACGDMGDSSSAGAADAGQTFSDACGPSGGSCTAADGTTASSPDTTASETWSSQDAWTADTASPGDTGPGGNTNVSFGGAQDFGYMRALIESGRVPHPTDLDPAGFYAEHATPLPAPVCGERLCVQAMLGVMANLINGQSCTMLQLGLNSPIVVAESDRPPLTLAVVVDVSGSMVGGDKIDYVKAGLERLVSELNDDDRIALITYETMVTVVQPMIEVRGHRNDLLGLVRGLAASGSTNLHDGLERGYDEILAHYDSGRQNRLILLSDGNPTVGITDTERILDMSAGYNSDGVGLTTVGLGTDFNLQLMQGLAEQADGNFYFLESGTAVDEVFTEELAYFTLPVAFDVTLEVRSGQLYDVDRISGTKRMTATGGDAKLEVPSVFFAHRKAHDDVHEGPDGVGRRGGGSLLLLEMMPTIWNGATPAEGDVAEVVLTFREPGSDALKEDRVLVHYPHAPGEILERGFFDGPIVTKSFVVMNLYFGIETACLLFHGGEAREARDLLEQVIAAAADYEDSANDGAGDVDIQLDIAMLDDLVAVIENLGGLNVPPPAPPANPWPCD